MPEYKYTTEEQIEAMREELSRAKQKQAGGKKNKKPVSVLKVASTSLFLIVVAVLVTVLSLVLVAKNRGDSVSFFGYRLYEIQSGSMSPTLKVGAVIVVREPEDKNALSVDDIVTFAALNGATVTHRIIEIVVIDEQVSYRTKGDNPLNSTDADLLTPDRVIGVFVAKIPLT